MSRIDLQELADIKEVVDVDDSRSSFATGHKFSQDWRAAILKTVTVNGTIKILGQIDHGSSDCLIRDSVAKDGGWFAEPGNPTGAIIINSIGGPMYPTKLIYVHLTIDEVQAHVVPLLVVPDDALPYPLMVGRTWTEQRSIGYIRDEEKLRFFYLTTPQHSLRKLIEAKRVFQTRNLTFSNSLKNTCYLKRILGDPFDSLHREQGTRDDWVQGNFQTLQIFGNNGQGPLKDVEPRGT